MEQKVSFLEGNEMGKCANQWVRIALRYIYLVGSVNPLVSDCGLCMLGQQMKGARGPALQSSVGRGRQLKTSRRGLSSRMNEVGKVVVL